MKMSIVEATSPAITVINVPKTCKAAIAGNSDARCRNLAVAGSDFCSQHNNGKATLSPQPDVVLIWFKLSDSWTSRFEKFLDVQRRSTRRQRQINDKNAAAAKKIGRNPNMRTTIVDSGSPVFGPKGVQGHRVWPCNIIADLSNAEYYLGKAEVCEKQLTAGGVEHRLLLEFRLEGDVFAGTAMEFLGDLFNEFGEAAFNQLLVWANPRKEDGEVVHTLNFRGRNIDQKPDCVLRFDGDNDWYLESTPPAETDAPVLA